MLQVQQTSYVIQLTQLSIDISISMTFHSVSPYEETCEADTYTKYNLILELWQWIEFRLV